MSSYIVSPPEPRRYPAIFESAGLYPDDDSNGAADAFEYNDGDLVPDGPFVETGEGEGEDTGEGEGEGEGEGDETCGGCFGDGNSPKAVGGRIASAGSDLLLLSVWATGLASGKRLLPHEKR